MASGAAENQLMKYLNAERKYDPPAVITKASGKPIGNKDTSLTVGPMGPILLQDHHMIDEMAHFNRERIPERVAHAKGGGAFGYFQVTHDITKYCASKMFNEIGKKTPMGARFSTVAGENGSADTIRESRGFALKFYTEDGVWDMVGNNVPVFTIRDPILFPSLSHVQKRNPVTHLKDPNMLWDFFTLRHESIHQVLMNQSDRGIPDGFRHMHGFGNHTFKLVNKYQQAVYCKFHFKTAQGIKNLTSEQGLQLQATDPDYNIRDLYNAIGRGDYPKWNMYIQVMTFEEADKFEFNPLDITKVWPQKRFPLIPVGYCVLNRNPENYFAEIEQMAFGVQHLIPGIEASTDKMLEARMFSYVDAQLYRVGTNHMQIPVNSPFKIKVANYERDGPMTFTDNQNGAPNYFPNSFGGPVESLWAKKLAPPYRIAGDVCRFDDNEDNYTQPGELWRKVFKEDERKRVIANLANALSPTYPMIQERAVEMWSRVDEEMGEMLSIALRKRRNS